MILFLTGEETFRLRERLKQLKNAFKEKYDTQQTSVVELDGRTLTIPIFHQAVSSMGLFSEKRFVVVEGIFQNKKTSVHNELLSYLQDRSVPEETVVVFVEPQKAPDRPDALWKFFASGKHAETFSLLSPRQLSVWIQDAVKKFDATIQPEAIQTLIHACGGNLWRLHHEISKLVHQYPGQILRVQDVRAAVQAPYDENIFHLVDAVISKQTVTALRLLEEQFRTGLEPGVLLSHLARQLRLITAIHRFPNPMSDPSIRNATGAHPYVIKKTRVFARRFQPQNVSSLLERLYHMDRQAKTRRVDLHVLFHQLIFAMTHSPR